MVVKLYSSPHEFEPLLPRPEVSESVLIKAHALQTIALQVKGKADIAVMQAIAPLLHAMNSYYTNKIEGQHTLPSEIENALAHSFSDDQDVRRKQRIAIAHMKTEQWAEQRYSGALWRELFSVEVIASLHRHLFSQLDDADLLLQDGSAMVPGALRTKEVKIAHHEAPAASTVPDFLERFDEFYSRTREGELAVVAVAAAHHRLAWIHPFPDGNGRVARLHSNLLLHAMGLTNGIWSPLRGLARAHQQYYKALGDADLHRQGDLDGRGNLSEKLLVEFVSFFLGVCIDQARFMTDMLDFQKMRQRIQACLAFESTQPGSAIRMEAELPLHTLFISGEMDRGDFKRMTGLGMRTADRLLRDLLAKRLLTSETPKGALRFGVPLYALRFYFPALWPEAEAQMQRSLS